MKQVFFTSLLAWLLIGIMPAHLQAQQTPGIVTTQGYGVADIGSELFNRREKQRLRQRIEYLEDQNARLEQQIYDLQRRLDDCSYGDRRRYRGRRNTSPYSLQQNLFGERRRLEQRYQELQRDNEFLRDQRGWLQSELNACERSYRDDRGRRGRDGYDNCGECRPKKKKPRRRYCDD